MVTVNLEQRARKLLAAEWERDGFSLVQAQDIRDGYVTNTIATALRAIVAALRQQPAPVDLELLNKAYAQGWTAAAGWAGARHLIFDCGSDAYTDERDARLLALIDNAGKAECATCGGRGWVDEGHEEDDGRMVSAIEDCPECTRQPAPVVDDGNGVRACPVLIAARAHDVGTTGVLRGNADLVPTEHTYLTTRPEDSL